MTAGKLPGAEAIAVKGWWSSHKWLWLRRTTQLLVLGLFLSGPLFGIWIIKGDIASSLVLDSLALSDPYVVIQTLMTGHWPETAALTGAFIVLVFYTLVGGRVYCGWICPINIVTDAAAWLRQYFGLSGSTQVPRRARYWVLSMSLIVAAVTGQLVWELVNPVTMVYRGLLFGLGMTVWIVLAIFLFDLIVSARGWCGHLCPMGAFYSLLSKWAPIRVSAQRRAECNDCMDCYVVCPEPQVIPPALKGAEKGIGPLILGINCSNCGRCIDVCSRNVFHFTTRFTKTSTEI